MHVLEIYTQAKMCQSRNKEPAKEQRHSLKFEHCDLAGPIKPTAKDVFKYAISFVDDFIGINMVYFIKQTSDTL